MQRRRLITTALALAAPAAWAQGSWPNRPIRMIVPYTPGGATDAMARLAALKIGEGIGQTVVVENRPGANGVIGTSAVLQAPADGYTILGSASTHVLMHLVLKAPGYDPLGDFQPVARTGRAPALLVMDPRRPQRSLAEVIAAAKAAPKEWSFGVSSLGASGHLAAIAFNRMTDAGIEVIPYRGTAPALTDVQAGNIQLMFDSAFALLPAARGGNVRALAIAARERSPLAPEIPTVIENGLPDFEFASWYGIWAARGVPAEIVRRMHAALQAGFADPAVVQRLSALTVEPVTESIAATEAYIAADVEKNAALLRYARFQPE
jgi:tripartite-type tricarboxylate transporter receptor subunit TctC